MINFIDLILKCLKNDFNHNKYIKLLLNYKLNYKNFIINKCSVFRILMFGFIKVNFAQNIFKLIEFINY